MIKSIVLLILLYSFTTIIAKETIGIPSDIRNSMDDSTKQNFNQSLQSFFSELEKSKINENMLTLKRADLTKLQLKNLIKYEAQKDNALKNSQDKQLINVYPISKNNYFVSISFLNQKPEVKSVLVYIINLVATKTKNKFTFSVPLDYLTRHWKTETIGNITYHFREKLNQERAILFDKKNSVIAEKLGLKPDKLNFYMTENFQEVSRLLGFAYSLDANGKYRDGYGVVDKTIFSIMNNEDFSHDMFHYYSKKINKNENRNWIAEEGIAYAWGNAYYTDQNGEMITHKRLIQELKKHIASNTNLNLFELFSKNENIFTHIATEISVRSTISGVIASHIEKVKGLDGISKLINAGSQDRLKNYLEATNNLIGLNKENFNLKVAKLIDEL